MKWWYVGGHSFSRLKFLLSISVVLFAGAVRAENGKVRLAAYVMSGKGKLECRLKTGEACVRDSKVPDWYQVPVGLEVTLTATPDTGYRLTAFTQYVAQGVPNQDCKSKENTCVVTMSKAQAVYAYFKPFYTLTINSSSGGSVACTSGNTPCPADQKYSDKAYVVLTANPDPGYKFSSWKGCSSSKDKTCNVVMNPDKAVTATFVELSPASLSVVEGTSLSFPDTRAGESPAVKTVYA
jgi:hypothetical protein